MSFVANVKTHRSKTVDQKNFVIEAFNFRIKPCKNLRFKPAFFGNNFFPGLVATGYRFATFTLTLANVEKSTSRGVVSIGVKHQNVPPEMPDQVGAPAPAEVSTCPAVPLAIKAVAPAPVWYGIWDAAPAARLVAVPTATEDAVTFFQ